MTPTGMIRWIARWLVFPATLVAMAMLAVVGHWLESRQRNARGGDLYLEDLSSWVREHEDDLREIASRRLLGESTDDLERAVGLSSGRIVMDGDGNVIFVTDSPSVGSDAGVMLRRSEGEVSLPTVVPLFADWWYVSGLRRGDFAARRSVAAAVRSGRRRPGSGTLPARPPVAYLSRTRDVRSRGRVPRCGSMVMSALRIALGVVAGACLLAGALWLVVRFPRVAAALFLVAVSATLFWIVVSGLRDGVIVARRSRYERRASPVPYWFYVVFYSFLGVVALGLGVYCAITPDS